VAVADGVVVDANVGIAWFFPSKPEERLYAGAVLDVIADSNALVVVPSLFHVELGNYLLKRRGDPASKFGRAKLEGALQKLAGLRWDTRLTPFDTAGIVRFAQRYHIQGKDAPYFALALTHKLPLATLDGGLIEACTVFGVERVSFS